MESRPLKRFARCRVGIVGKCIQEKIGQPIAGHVLLTLELVSKYEAARINATDSGFLPKIFLRQRVVAK